MPEGDYSVNPEDYQDRRKSGLLQEILGYAGRGGWRGGQRAWGDERVWVKPEEDTDTKGRDGFSVHGGEIPGSAGCLDLTKYNEDFMKKFKKLKRKLRLKVRYPDKFENYEEARKRKDQNN